MTGDLVDLDELAGNGIIPVPAAPINLPPADARRYR